MTICFWTEPWDKIKVTYLPEGCVLLVHFISLGPWVCEMIGLRHDYHNLFFLELLYLYDGCFAFHVKLQEDNSLIWFQGPESSYIQVVVISQMCYFL